MKGIILIAFLLAFLNSAFSFERFEATFEQSIIEQSIITANELQLRCPLGKVYSSDLGICLEIIQAFEIVPQCPEHQVFACDPDSGKGCKCVCSHGLLCAPDDNTYCVCNPYPPRS